MLQYMDKEMMLDNVRGTHVKRFMVVDINAQGILELDVVHRRLQNEFPLVAKRIKLMASIGALKIGEIYDDACKGYHFKLLCTRHARVGALKDDVETVTHITKKLIDQLGKDKSKYDIYESGFLNRDLKGEWDKLVPIIKSNDFNWVVLKE